MATATPELRKGPRGGGRDRDDVARHVQEAERSYGRMLGVRLPPRTPWDEQRQAFAAAVRAGAPGARWPLPYAVRRFAWHVLATRGRSRTRVWLEPGRRRAFVPRPQVDG